MTQDEKAIIASVIASQISIRRELNDMTAQLSIIEERHEDDASIAYQIGRSIGQLDAVFGALARFEVTLE